MKMILTVCTGNICRSPIAEFALRANEPSLDCRSAGLGALVGSDVDVETRNAALAQGLVVPKHRAQQCSQELIREASVILVMESHHRRQITQQWPFASGKTFLLGHFENEKTIPDPYKMGTAVHMHAVSLILSSTRIWAPKLRHLS